MRVICKCFRCQGKIVDYRTAQKHQDSTPFNLEQIICKLCTPHHSISRHDYYAYHRANIIHHDYNENAEPSSLLQDDGDSLMQDTDDSQINYLSDINSNSSDNQSERQLSYSDKETCEEDLVALSDSEELDDLDSLGENDSRCHSNSFCMNIIFV